MDALHIYLTRYSGLVARNKLSMNQLLDFQKKDNTKKQFLFSHLFKDTEVLNKRQEADISRNIVLLHELKKVIKAFNIQEIPVIVLKGAAFLETVYPDISMRQMHDIDVLIKKQDLEKVNNVLSNLGYNPLHDYKKYLDVTISPYLNSLVFRKKFNVSFYLHLHWHLVNTTIPATTYYDKINLERICQQAEPLDKDDDSFLTLSKHHTIIHLSEHAMNHFYLKPYLLEDIHLFIKKYNSQIDWEKVVEEAYCFGLEKFVYYTLSIAASVFKTAIPNDILIKLAPGKVPFLEKYLFNRAKKGKFSKWFGYISYLTMEKGILKRLEFIFKYLFRPQAVRDHIKKLG